MAKRQRERRDFVEVADLRGRRCAVGVVRGGGDLRLVAGDFSSEIDESTQLAANDAEPPQPPGGPQSHDHRSAHYLAILLEAARSVLTPKQFEAAEEVIVRRRSLHAVAAERGGSVEAWRARIEGKNGRGGIREYAPVLYAVWMLRNHTRRDTSDVLNALKRALNGRSVL